MPQTNAQPTSLSLSNKHIIVSRAGIAGLAVIIALSHSWPLDVAPPHITLYERREKAISPDREGYTISICSDRMSGGMLALQQLDLLDEVLEASVLRSEGGKGGFHLWDRDFRPILRFRTPEKPPNGLPVHGDRIARYLLRQCLIDALPESCEVRWGTSCETAERLEDGRMRVLFSGGRSGECDLLVAADGANSKTRAALRLKDVLKHAGVSMIAASARFEDDVPDDIKESF